MSVKDLVDQYESDVMWGDRRNFDKFIKTFKEYLRIRPNLFEDYPELLV